MSNQRLKKIVESKDKDVHLANNALARLFRQILYDLDFDLPTFTRMLDDYVIRENAKRPKTFKSSLKTNLIASLSSAQMSFKYFERFLAILRPKSVTFKVSITWRHNEVTEHEVKMDIVNDTTPIPATVEEHESETQNENE